MKLRRFVCSVLYRRGPVCDILKYYTQWYCTYIKFDFSLICVDIRFFTYLPNFQCLHSWSKSAFRRIDFEFEGALGLISVYISNVII